MPLPSGTDAQTIGSGASGGMLLGETSAEKVGFFGATTITQPTSASQAALATTAAVTAGGAYGFANASQANGIITLVNQIRSDLVNLGLIKGS